MEIRENKVTLHMVCSLDGFIAKSDGSIEWMKSESHYAKGVDLTQEMIDEYLEGIDCYIMGANTYEHAVKLGWAYGDKPVTVLTNRLLQPFKDTVKFYSGTLLDLIEEDLKPHYRNIWVVGGAQITKSFLQANLVDEIVMAMMPMLLGEGLLFFDYIDIEKRLHLKDVQAFKDGMVELTYIVLKN